MQLNFFVICPIELLANSFLLWKSRKSSSRGFIWTLIACETLSICSLLMMAIVTRVIGCEKSIEANSTPAWNRALGYGVYLLVGDLYFVFFLVFRYFESAVTLTAPRYSRLV